MPSTITTFQLKNGLTVIAKPLHQAPVVSVYIWYRVGSRNERPGQSGMAHFLEHMMFKGSRQYAKGEIARLVGRTGGNQNAFTSLDYTAYFETLPSEHLELALKIEADRMVNATLLPKEFEQERTVVLSELDGRQNHPEVRLRELVNAQTWLQHPYRRPVIGWREEVVGMELKRMKSFYQEHYRPQNATLVVVGDFQLPKLRDLVQRNFGSLRPGPETTPLRFPAEVQKGERRVVLRDHGSASILRMNIPLPPAGHPDHYALAVLNDALTKGKASRLYKALVETGLATSVSGAPLEMIDQGYWTLHAVCQPGVSPETVEKAMRKQFEQVKFRPLSTREFQRSLNQTRAELIYARDSLTDQAMLLGFFQTVAGDYRLLDQYPEKIAAVTPAQVQQAARKYLVSEKMTIGYFLPLPGGKPGMPGPAPGDVLSAWPESRQSFRRPVWSGPALLPVSGDRGGGGSGGSRQAQRIVLPNGLILLVHPNPANPMFVLSGLIQGGMAREPGDKPGVAVVHAQMLDRGTKKRTFSQLTEALEFKGAHLSYTVNKEELHFNAEALSEDLDLVLGILAESLQQPAFPEAELKKVKKQVHSHCLMAKDDSRLQAWQGFFELAYPPGHPLTRSLISAEPGISRLTRSDVLAFHQRIIRPERTILSISGDVNPAQVKKAVEKLFRDWNTGQGPEARAWEKLPPLPRVKTVKKTTKTLPGKRESIVVLGHEGIHRLDPDYYPAYLANHVLGGAGLSSLLMREVRDRAGLTYSIYSMFKLSHGIRPWCLSLQANPDQAARAVEMALAEVKRLQAGKIKEQDLDDARGQLVGGLSLSLETNAGIAYLNREVEYHRLGENYLADYTRAVRGVTFTRMVQAARKWLHPEAVVISVVAPEKKKTKK